jgi:hypothetical protein
MKALASAAVILPFSTKGISSVSRSFVSSAELLGWLERFNPGFTSAPLPIWLGDWPPGGWQAVKGITVTAAKPASIQDQGRAEDCTESI